MPFETDERLKHYLDTNQLGRERMCLGILQIDRRFTDVRPRHPRGGRDGGRDIDAIFQGEQKAIGAVGFVNQATESAEIKRTVKRKFAKDLKSAIEAEPQLKVFVFFTNVNLTTSEKDALVLGAKAQGLAHCEIMDRERMRVALDGVDGLSIRVQFLDIPMSPAEQATFFARWGDDIRSTIAEGFGEVKKALNRVQFLHELRSPLERLALMLQLDREYEAIEIGHFRFFATVSLPEMPGGTFMATFGTTDRPNREKVTSVDELEAIPAGIIHGRANIRWERRLPKSDTEDLAEDKIGGWSSGQTKVSSLHIEYGHLYQFFRPGPTIRLADIDGAMLALFLNRSLADKVNTIHVFGNEYMPLQLRPSFRTSCRT